MKAHELLDSPEKWTQHVLARNKDDEAVNPRDPEATCWCLWGAVTALYDDNNGDVYREVLNAVHKKAKEVTSIGLWNDNPNRTFEEVRSILKELDI